MNPNFMEKLLAMQSQMEEMKTKLDQTFVEGFSPRELVKVRMNASRLSATVEIKQELNSFEKEELEDYISLAIQDALKKANDHYEKEMKGAAGNMLPGMGL